MAYIIDNDTLDDRGKEFREYVDSEMKSRVNELANLFRDTKWTGPAKDAYLGLYQEKLKPLFEVTDKLEKFGYYMQFVAEKFNEVNTESQSEFKKFVDELESEKL